MVAAHDSAPQDTGSSQAVMLLHKTSTHGAQAAGTAWIRQTAHNSAQTHCVDQPKLLSSIHAQMAACHEAAADAPLLRAAPMPDVATMGAPLHVMTKQWRHRRRQTHRRHPFMTPQPVLQYLQLLLLLFGCSTRFSRGHDTTYGSNQLHRLGGHSAPVSSSAVATLNNRTGPSMAPLQLHTLVFRRLCAAACNVQIAQPKAQPACIAIRPAASASPAAQLEQPCRRPPSILACNRLLLGVPGRSPCGWVRAWRRHCWVPSCRGWRHVTSWHLLGLHGRVHNDLLWGRLDHLYRLHRLWVVRGTHHDQGVDHACGMWGLSDGAGRQLQAHATGSPGIKPSSVRRMLRHSEKPQPATMNTPTGGRKIAQIVAQQSRAPIVQMTGGTVCKRCSDCSELSSLQ